MFTIREVTNSYLSRNEFIYHAGFIGFGAGILEMLFDYYNILSSGEPLPTEGSYILILFIPLIYPVATAIFALVSALFIYPLYSYYAKRKGGLNIVLNSKDHHNESL